MAIESVCPKACRVLVTGITSIHGWPVYQRLQTLLGAHRIFGIRPPAMKVPEGSNIASVCMTDHGSLRRVRDAFRPTHVLHAAGVCDLDVCEQNPKLAHAINVHGARNIASLFSDSCYIMYLSSDLVFSGNAPAPGGYAETHPTDPVSVVGTTYVQAEKEIAHAGHRAVIRLGLPMGDSIQGKKGAVDFIEGRLKRGLPTSLFHDEYRSCIRCDDLADAVTTLLFMEVRGILHVGGPRPVSLYEIGERILNRGHYPREALRRWSRTEDVYGPPRIGNVHLNSNKAESILGRRFLQWEG